MNICYINATQENEFLTLNLLGKPVIYYAVTTACQTNVFDRIICITGSKHICYIIKQLFGEQVELSDTMLEETSDSCSVMTINATAVMLKAETIVSVMNSSTNTHAVTSYVDYEMHQADQLSEKMVERVAGTFLSYHAGAGLVKSKTLYLSPTEAITINSKNDFELALVLKTKEKKNELIINMIRNRIDEKAGCFQTEGDEKSITLIGHSQLDNWTCSSLSGYKVINCSIRGISSKEYDDYILKLEKLKCLSKLYLVMHGTNDIVYDYTDQEILDNINKTFEYIKRHDHNAKILFIKCISTNERMDRQNIRIRKLNQFLTEHLEKDIIQIDVDDFNDEFGQLQSNYTIDGLHLSEEGYKVLEKLVENTITKINMN